MSVSVGGVSVAEHTRQSFSAAIVAWLDEEFGRTAGISLDGWEIYRAAPEGAQVFRVGRFGSIALDGGADGAEFCRALEARLTDFEAIEAARDRADRISALSLAANEFGGELDLDRTLQIIVQRGLALTGTDLCYLSLNDVDRGDTYIRTTAGTRTDAFRGLRLTYGEGLGGLVASEGRTFYSPDYQRDDRFIHVVDGAVAEEGMVSVLAVPLRLADSVIGVLFSGNRKRTTFGREDIEFLESLGDHAAVAIENARLYGQIDRAWSLHHRLTDLVLSEQPIETLESEIGSALGLSVRVLPPDAKDDRGISLPIRVGPRALGTLRVEAASLDAESRMALEQSARVVALHLMRERAVTYATMRNRGELLDAVMSRSRSDRELEHRAAAYGVDLSNPVYVMVIRGDHADSLTRSLPSAFVATRLGVTVVLAASREQLPDVEDAATGPAVVGPSAVANSISEATRILEIANVLGRRGVLTRNDLGVYGMLINDSEAATAISNDSRALLSPLIAYDVEHGSSLIETLEAFLDEQGRSAAVARRLHVHVNSVYYRLARIRELADWTLEDPDVRLQVHLACRVLRLSRP